MGIVMKKMVLLATALALLSGSALAADMAVKAVKAPVPAPFDPWDIAFRSEGDRHEENGFAGNGAGTALRFGSRGRHGRQGGQGAGTRAVRSLGYRLPI